MRRFIIDCDTAEDDIMSFFMLVSRGFSVEGITVVEGNINFDQEVKNALWMSELAEKYTGRKYPVFPGMRRPIVKDYRTVENVHGNTGVGEYALTPTREKPQSKHAIDAIIELSEIYPGELEFLAISPLTNLALAWLKYPRIAGEIKKVYVMGGTIHGRGNITPSSEYNIWVDPEAAKIVFNAGFDITMVSWDLITDYVIEETEWEKIKSMKTEMAQLYVKIYSHYRNYAMSRQRMKGNPHPDVITTSVAINPDVAKEVREEYVIVDTSDGPSRGATFIDYLGITGNKPNAKVVYSINREKFLEEIFFTLGWK
ncbi:nucleoside hydrolase [Sulfolobales archaeon HS-7]|nr:nucleoside hydrolase [Sulfolobales archaeon HS-7]